MRAPPRILIADDNPESLDIFQTRLAVHGYEILTATEGEQALAIAREKQPDLILSTDGTGVGTAPRPTFGTIDGAPNIQTPAQAKHNPGGRFYSG